MVLSCKVIGFTAVLVTISINNNIIYKNYNKIHGNELTGQSNSTSTVPGVVIHNETDNKNNNLTLKTDVTDANIASAIDSCNRSDECGLRCHGPEKNFVVHGAEVDPLDWPWLAILYKIDNEGIGYDCVGSLVTRDKVVTAAHCVVGSLPQQYVMFLSRFNTRLWGPNDESVMKEVTNITIHPTYYKNKTTGADLAVLTLKHKTKYNQKIRPVCLFAHHPHQPYELQGTVVGWGRNEHYEVVTSEPSQVDMRIVKTEECVVYNERFKNVINDYKFCAGNPNNTEGIGPCQGDSGGGFYAKRKTSKGQEIWGLRGVVSGSLRLQDKDDCLDQKYFTFTDMEKQIGWIRDQIEVDNGTYTNDDKISEEKRQNISRSCTTEIAKSKSKYIEGKKYFNSQIYSTENLIQTLERSKKLQIRKFQEAQSTTGLGYILKFITQIKKLNSSMEIPIRSIAKFAYYFPTKKTSNILVGIIRAEREKGKGSLLGGDAYNLESFQYLLSAGADPLAKDDLGRSTLAYAVIYENFEVIKYLVNNFNVSINEKDKTGWTALGYAVHSGNNKIVKYLITDHNADCNTYNNEGYTPFQWAAYSGKYYMVKYLLESCDSIDVNTKSKNGKTALDLAVSEGFQDIMHYLYPKTSGEHDIFDTPLHKAVFNNDIDAIKKLLAKKIDVNIRDVRNQTALIWAAKSGDLDVFRYLAEAGKANISLGDEHGYTVAHWAAFSGHLNILKYLVDKFKIDLNVQDNGKSTPLHWAAGLGKLNIVKYLVREQKVDTQIKNHQNHKAIDKANTNYEDRVVEWMKNYENKKREENIKNKSSSVFVNGVPSIAIPIK